MARYYGHWQIQPPQQDHQGRLLRDRNGDLLQTRYLKGVRPRELRHIRHVMNHFATKLSQQARNTSWADLERMLDSGRPLPHIGNDPKQYTLEQVVRDILAHLQNHRSTGRPHDLTRSFIDRHNYLVGLWARALQDLDPDAPWTMFDDMLIDIRDPDSDMEQHRANLEDLWINAED